MSGTRYDTLTKNETVLRKKTGEKILTISDDTGISESSIRGWCKEYEQNGEFIDNNNNDAIPSWSGYNYQGKAMILCVLQKIRFILESNLSLTNWSVELEKLQDFVLKNDSGIISLWQVKATLAKNKVIGYSDALEKLLSDKLNSNSKTAECYIISATDIIDWNEEENKYNQDVKLYKYSNEERIDMNVGLLEIPQHIKFELKMILLKLNINLETEKAYLSVCNYINEIVANLHLQGKSANYEIYFDDIINYLKTNSISEKILFESKLKEYIYQKISKNICEDIDIYCKDCKEKDCDSSNECAIERYNELTHDIDLFEFVLLIRPDIESENPDAYLWKVDDIFQENILDLIKESDNNAVFRNVEKIGINIKKGEVKILPTLVTFDKAKNERISRTLEKIVQNNKIKGALNDVVLTVSHLSKSVILNTELDKTTNFNRKQLFDQNGNIKENKIDTIELLNNDKEEMATRFKHNVVLVDKDMIIDYLKEINKND